MNELRSTFCITKGRSFVKEILKLCTVCKRAYAYPGHSDLPPLRFDDRHAFTSTGCDHLGPLHVLPIYGRQYAVYKAHVVIYTCAASRAVIIDVVNLSNTQNVVQSFRRFIARRWCPSIMISNNVASFTADETQKSVADRFIECKFNVAKAPNWGGMWKDWYHVLKDV